MKRDRAIAAARDSVEWIEQALGRFARGVHQLGEPAYVLDTELPVGLAEVYRQWDGGELFHGSLILVKARDFQRGVTDRGWPVGEVDGDELVVDRKGRVWRHEADTEELLCDGSSFDRWLAGYVAAEAVVYDSDGEFREGIHDEHGELLPSAAIAREEAALGRDRRAPAPRWRLARHLVRAGRVGEAREQLETVVAEHEGFAWAWFDLGRISESLGELDGAADEYQAAAEASEGQLYAGYFWSQVARVSDRLGDEARRKEAAAQAAAVAPDLVRDQLEGARESMLDGELGSARELALTAASLAPRDLGVLDLLRQLERLEKADPPHDGADEVEDP